MAYKTIFRFIGGKLRALKIKEFTASGLYHSNKQVEGGKQALGLWKKIKSSIFARTEFYKPGGVFDPVSIEKEREILSKHHALDMMNNIKAKFGKDTISQKRGEKAAEKAKGFIDATWELFHGEKNVFHLGKDEIMKKAKAGISKRQFSEALSDTETFKNIPRYVKESGVEMFELKERGGYGVKEYLKTFSKQRKKDALRFYKETKIQLPKPATIDRMINARGKGIKFMNKNGKLIIKRGN